MTACDWKFETSSRMVGTTMNKMLGQVVQSKFVLLLDESIQLFRSIDLNMRDHFRWKGDVEILVIVFLCHDALCLVYLFLVLYPLRWLRYIRTR